MAQDSPTPDQFSGAELHEDGVWRLQNGKPLRVSASDLERHEYCPLSWSLAREGKRGQGEAITAGVEKHATIHGQVKDYQEKHAKLRMAMVIWSWWFAVILVFTIDAIAFSLIDDVVHTPLWIARYMALWALSLLITGIVAVYLPWREWIGWTNTIAKSKGDFHADDTYHIESILQPQGFIGGWFEAGRVEAALFMSAIALALHSIALVGAENKSQAGFLLAVLAMAWTLIASWQLQKALLVENALEIAREIVGLHENTEIAYSDNEDTSSLLKDPITGLRGRPDQIVIVDGEFIPVEQKTGRVPKHPHRSHKIQVLAYLHLVELNTKISTPYGVLRYGNEDLYQIPWDDENKGMLFDAIAEVQRLMVHNDAKRNHQRPGKCKNCSRNYACPDALV
ncbi:MAG: Dna2/Cas4 domain-containing protein [archaeon]|nr:Dna2/Cas4 domain-containing protein [archaeon]MDA1130828.1 Dna2/Cas4 domain-containing protein [archaeon]